MCHGALIAFLYFQHRLKHTASKSNVQATPTLPLQTCLAAHLSHLYHLLNSAYNCSTASKTYRSAPSLGSKSTAHIGSATGECDYAQQGYLYRHEVPLDRSTLEKLGLRDIPHW